MTAPVISSRGIINRPQPIGDPCYLAVTTETGIASLIHRPGIRQFVKFCIIGATSFTIDIGISYVLTFHFLLWWVLAKTISFSLAVTNGFFWNQRWTFKAVGHRSHHEQY